MKNSKNLVKVSPNIENGINNGGDYIGFNEEMLTGFMLKTLKQYDRQRRLDIGSREENRKYYLFKRPSKKKGYIYQMKVIDPETGVILPTKFSTGKTNEEEANQWAEENYKTCLESYNGKGELKLLDEYYNPQNKYYKYEIINGRKISEKGLKDRRIFIARYITPFFQSKKIRFLSQITPIHILDLKDHLTKEDLTPQTINMNLQCIKRCFALFRYFGKITTDFTNVSFTIEGSKRAAKIRGVFPNESLKGVFSMNWKSKLHRVLMMTIYLCGIRNGEVYRMRLNDIESINDVYFLNVRGTKSDNATRKTPIHPILYQALETYVKENNISKDAEIFGGMRKEIYRHACFEMGSLLGYTEKQLVDKNICYYSGRHSFKSVLDLGDKRKIGDVNISFVEMFMGHNYIEADLKSKKINEYNYKHLTPEVLGNLILSETGKEVFKILDHFYF